MHVHIYTTLIPDAQLAAMQLDPSKLRDLLLQPADRITATLETPVQAAEWHGRNLEANPSAEPDWGWGAATRERMVEEMARALGGRGDVVNGWYMTADVLIATAFIPCPAEGGRYSCPEGRADGPEGWSADV